MSTQTGCLDVLLLPFVDLSEPVSLQAGGNSHNSFCSSCRTFPCLQILQCIKLSKHCSFIPCLRQLVFSFAGLKMCPQILRTVLGSALNLGIRKVVHGFGA